MQRYNIGLLIVGALMSFGSCVNMDLVPLSQGNSESWYTTETELQMAVNEFYVLGYWNRGIEASEQWTDNFSYRNIHRNDILNGTLLSKAWEADDLWKQSYKLIARANTLLEKSGKAEDFGISPEKVKQYNSEAYFARACKYAELISYFGNVPYLDKYITVQEAFEKGRTPKEEIIPLVYDDFDKAAEGLPVSYGSFAKHFTKGAAYAMKARYALYWGDWSVAAEAAKKCIDLKEYELHADFTELFLTNTRTNTKEKVFALPRSIALDVVLEQWVVNNELPRNAGGYGSACPSWDLLAAFTCTDGLPIDESPLFDPQNPFKNRDPRCAKTIVEFGTEHVGFEFDPHPEKLKVMNFTTGLEQTNNDNRAVNQYASYNALNWKKFIDATWLENGKKVDRDYVIMRYADVLLMYAEAKTELNEIDDSVLEAINAVRARGYGVSPVEVSLYPIVAETNQTKLRRIIRNERRVELANEGLRYMDLIRWRLATKALNTKNYGILYPASDLINQVTSKGLWFWPSTPQIDEDGVADFSAMENAGQISVLSQRVFPEHQYLWPIPLDETQSCPMLAKDQNPGY